MALDLSVVIPIYDARDIAKDSVDRLVKGLDSFGVDYEILLRDDGSKDASHQVLKEIARQNPRVKCFSNDGNRGLGYTLVKLFQEAGGNNIIYCDCDLPFGVDIIPSLLEGLKRNDVVIASRYRGLPNNIPWNRKIVSRLNFIICKFLFKISFADIGSGTIAIQKRALDQLDLKTTGFGIHAELFFEAAKKGLLITEVPAQSHLARKGSFRIWKHGLRTLWETVGLWLRKL